MGLAGLEMETKLIIKKVLSNANTKTKVTILCLLSISSGRLMILYILVPRILTHTASLSIIWIVCFPTKNTQTS